MVVMVVVVIMMTTTTSMMMTHLVLLVEQLEVVRVLQMFHGLQYFTAHAPQHQTGQHHRQSSHPHLLQAHGINI